MPPQPTISYDPDRQGVRDFFVWIVFFGKAKQGREVADKFDLEFAIDRVQTDFIDKRAEYFCSFVARCILI